MGGCTWLGHKALCYFSRVQAMKACKRCLHGTACVHLACICESQPGICSQQYFYSSGIAICDPGARSRSTTRDPKIVTSL